MRVIERKMVEAFKACLNGCGKDYKLGNTRVHRIGDVVRVYLHGNLIIQHDVNYPEEYYFDTCGWNTRTTYSRMNSFAYMMGLQLRFYTHKHVPHVMSRGKSTKCYGSHYYGKD